MRCQASNCNGFVSKSYKCELCEKTTCSKCFEIVEENHECKPENIETAEFIKKSSKPCPTCATRISRIDGCYQMWCTNCKTAFDWQSGLKLTNVVIHNPHYYQYLQTTNNGAVPRNPNDIVCGGMPDLNRFRYCMALIKDANLQRFITTNVYSIYRYIGHIQTLLNRHIIRNFERSIQDTRVQLILNRITEEDFKNAIFKHYTLKNKRTVNNRLLETVHTVGVDIIQRYCKMYESQMPEIVIYDITYKLMQEFVGIVDYFNTLQEEKTALFKEVGIRIRINVMGPDISKLEIPAFDEKNFTTLQFGVVGVLL
jgi:hypothetical protein